MSTVGEYDFSTLVWKTLWTMWKTLGKSGFSLKVQVRNIIFIHE